MSKLTKIVPRKCAICPNFLNISSPKNTKYCSSKCRNDDYYVKKLKFMRARGYKCIYCNLPLVKKSKFCSDKCRKLRTSLERYRAKVKLKLIQRSHYRRSIKDPDSIGRDRLMRKKYYFKNHKNNKIKALYYYHVSKGNLPKVPLPNDGRIEFMSSNLSKLRSTSRLFRQR